MSDIYIDLDGVLANWTKGITKACGVDYPRNQILKPYILDSVLARSQIESAMSPRFFWAELEKFPWADEIIDIARYCPTWRFLTRANLTPDSFSGKADWIDIHYKHWRERLVVCRGSKAFACKPGDILIDDHPKNIDEWNTCGGHGFFWPEISDDYDYRAQLESLRSFVFDNY